MGEERVLVAGETLCDFFPEGSTGLSGSSFSWRPGGAPANVAVALARLGHPPYFWTRVGDDPFGAQLAETLHSAGVSTDLVESDSAEHTTLAFVDTDNEDFLFYRGADRALSANTVPIDALSAVNWIVAGGVSLSEEPARSATTTLLDEAQAAGCHVLFDPNARPELWRADEFVSVIGKRLPAIDVLCVTRSELESLAPASDGVKQCVEELHDRGPQTICVTEGAAGARLFATSDAPWGPATVSHGGFSVDAVDPVGAGDAFNAGLLWAVLEGDTTPERMLERANAVAAIATTDVGAMAALPDHEAVTSQLL